MKDPITSLITLLYIFIVDYVTNGATGRSHEVFDHLKEAYRLADKSYKARLQPELDDAMRAAGKNPESKALAYAALGVSLKSALPEILHDKNITSQQVDLFKALGLYLRSDSPAALSKLSKLALSATQDSWISQKRLKEEAPRQDDSELRFLVRKLTGRDDNKLTLDEATQVKVKYPKLYKDYLALRRVHTQSWKDALQAFVRQSGSTLVTMKEFEAFCKQNNIETSLPKGFTGKIDDLGRFYTMDRKLIDGVPNTPTFPKVLMNKNYGKADGGDWVFMAVRANGGPGPYFYTTEFKQHQRAKKFARVKDFSKVIDSMQKKWFLKVKDFDPTDPKCIAATILELLYEFSARIGGRGNMAHGEPTFGISTLLVKHVYPQTNGDIFLRYPGKDGVQTKHVLRHADRVQKFVISNIMQLIEGKRPRDPVFTVERGTRQLLLTPAAVNQYFRSLGAPAGVTVHKLRTLRATKLFRAELDKLAPAIAAKAPLPQKTAMELLKTMAMKVGKALNHVRRSPSGDQKVTPTTALKNYIDPAIQVEFFEMVGVRVPPYLEAMI